MCKGPGARCNVQRTPYEVQGSGYLVASTLPRGAPISLGPLIFAWLLQKPVVPYRADEAGSRQRVGAMRAWTCVLLSVCAYGKAVADNPAFMMVSGISGAAEMCLAAASGA